MIGVTYRKTLAVGFARWEAGLLENCEDSGVLVMAQGPMLGRLTGPWFSILTCCSPASFQLLRDAESTHTMKRSSRLS